MQASRFVLVPFHKLPTGSDAFVRNRVDQGHHVLIRLSPSDYGLPRQATSFSIKTNSLALGRFIGGVRLFPIMPDNSFFYYRSYTDYDRKIPTISWSVFSLFSFLWSNTDAFHFLKQVAQLECQALK